MPPVPRAPSWDTIKWDQKVPKWLSDVAESGRLMIDLPGRHLTYHAPEFAKPITVEPGAWLINRGKGVLRVVDNSTFEAVIGIREH